MFIKAVGIFLLVIYNTTAIAQNVSTTRPTYDAVTGQCSSYTDQVDVVSYGADEQPETSKWEFVAKIKSSAFSGSYKSINAECVDFSKISFLNRTWPIARYWADEVNLRGAKIPNFAADLGMINSPLIHLEGAHVMSGLLYVSFAAAVDDHTKLDKLQQGGIIDTHKLKTSVSLNGNAQCFDLAIKSQSMIEQAEKLYSKDFNFWTGPILAPPRKIFCSFVPVEDFLKW